MATGRAAMVDLLPSGIWVAAERLPEILAVHPQAAIEGQARAPAARASRSWTRESAIV